MLYKVESFSYIDKDIFADTICKILITKLNSHTCYYSNLSFKRCHDYQRINLSDFKTTVLVSN